MRAACARGCGAFCGARTPCQAQRMCSVLGEGLTGVAKTGSVCLLCCAMFFSSDLVRGKSALGRLWCAAWKPDKLKKSTILEFNIEDGVKALTQPEQPLALRLEAHLLFGLSRVQYRKCVIFEEETKSAYNRLHVSFHSSGAASSVDMKEKKA